jgi:hypothetical protein
MQQLCFQFHDINIKLAVTDIGQPEASSYEKNVIFPLMSKIVHATVALNSRSVLLHA